MEAFVALVLTMVVSLALFLKNNKALTSLLTASLIMPVFVIYAEFYLPYQGGGVSMWPLALIIGSAAGAISSALGVCLGFLIRKVLKGKDA